MARTPEEKIHAMQLLAEGKSRAEVSRLTGFDTKTLAVYWTRYLKDGDAAFKRKRKGYSPGRIVGEFLFESSSCHPGCDEIDAVSSGVDDARRDVLGLDMVPGNKNVRECTFAGRGVVTKDAGIVRLMVIIQA